MRHLCLLLPLAALACTKPTTEARPAPKATAPAPAEAAPRLGEGDPAPQVVLTLQDGSTFSPAEATGLVLVYFYPKDDTPGCTVEAQGLRDEYEALTAAGVKVIGVSLQDAASHQAFIAAHRLPFSLAVDDGTAAAAFDVPVQGEYAARHSFLLKGGKVVKVWRAVNPSEHAAQVLAAARDAA